MMWMGFLKFFQKGEWELFWGDRFYDINMPSWWHWSWLKDTKISFCKHERRKAVHENKIFRIQSCGFATLDCQVLGNGWYQTQSLGLRIASYLGTTCIWSFKTWYSSFIPGLYFWVANNSKCSWLKTTIIYLYMSWEREDSGTSPFFIRTSVLMNQPS